MVAHHEVVKIVSHELRVLFLAIGSWYEVGDLFKGLGLDAYLDRLGELQIFFEGEPRRKSIRRALVGHRSQELHRVVGRNAVADGDCIAFGDGLGQEEGDVGDGLGVGQVDVEDSVCILKASDYWLSGHEQGKGHSHVCYR